MVWFLCMPSAMMVTGVCEHTSVAQLASNSSSVSTSLANSLRVHELDMHHEQKLDETKLPQASCIWPNVLLLRRSLAKPQGQSTWKSAPICRGSESRRWQKRYTGRQHYEHCRKDGQKKQSWLPQISLVAVRELRKTQAFEDGLTEQLRTI